MGAIGLTGILAWVAGIILAIIVAAVVLIFNVQKYAIEIITAAAGVAISIAGLVAPFQNSVADPGELVKTTITSSWLWVLLWLVMAIFAFIFQERTNREFLLEEPENAW